MDQEKDICKYGVIYLSYVPVGLNVKIIREILEDFGEVGKIYLEPESNNHRKFSEGWIEFKKKRVAKLVAKTLNGKALQYGKKRSKINGQIWSIKYLHRFKWAHLTEQLRHDRAVKDQKRRFEITQAKKQAEFYQKLSERSKHMKKVRNPETDLKDGDDERHTNRAKAMQSRQNKPISQGDEMAVSVSEDLLSSIFKKV